MLIPCFSPRLSLIFYSATLKLQILIPKRFPPLSLLVRTYKSRSTRDVYACNVRIAELSRGGRIEAARQLFDAMAERDVVSWNAMVTGYWQNGFLDKSKLLFESMPVRNVVTWNSMIMGCLESNRLDEALGYFSNMPERNTRSWNAMISGFVRCGRIEEAVRLFEEVPRKNVISYTAMIDGYAQVGEIEKARALFDQMRYRNSVCWTVMISGYVENGKLDEAKKLFDQMPEKNVVLATAMIIGYCKEGEVENGRVLFDRIKFKDLISFNTMISGYAQNGYGEEALKLLINMLRRGHLQKAYDIIREMPFEVDSRIWGALLSGCCAYSNLEIGELAAEKLMEFDPKSSGAYVALSNIYAEAGLWKNVKRVRGLMKEHEAKKQPAYSWLEVANKVHFFVGGDVTHPNIYEIRSRLKDISLQMNSIEDIADIVM